MKEILKNLLMIAFAILIATAFSSCESNKDDEPEDPWDDEYSEYGYSVNNNGHEYVDLGLSVYWATCNVGAYNSYSLGEKFAFGETSSKYDFNENNFYGGNSDVVKSMWGGDWRMPTQEEFQELISKCKWSHSIRNGVKVFTATGPSGNSVDFAAKAEDTFLTAWYWSSTSYSNDRAICMFLDGPSISLYTNLKYFGFYVKGVITNPNFNGYDFGNGEDNDNNNYQNSSSYEKPEIGLMYFTCETNSITLKYRIYNQDKAKVTSAKGYYGTSSPSKSVTATVAGSLITIRVTGLSKGTTYYFKCTATGKGGSTTSDTTKLMTLY